jgi:hypothetical protein
MRVALLLAVMGISASAHAQTAEVYLEVKDTQPPSLQATVVDAPRLPANLFTLRPSGDPNAPPIHPLTVRTFADGTEPIAVALVMCGQELFVGNDQFETDENATYLGVLMPLEHGLDTLGLSRIGPAGSTISVVTYDTGARIAVPTMPLDKFRGDVLGSQKDYRGKIGTDMVQGIELGLRQLAASDAPHKVMIVIGDGNDTNNEAAQSALKDLKRLAARSNVTTEAVIYKSVVSAEGEIISKMIPTAKMVNSIDGMTAAIGDGLGRVTSRYYLTFVDKRLPWDGQTHDLILTIDKTDADPVTMTLPDLREPGTPWWRGRLAQVGIGVLLVGLLIAGARIRT